MSSNIEKAKKTGLFKAPGDIIIYAVLIILTLILVVSVLSVQKTGNYIVVYREGKIFSQYELLVDAEYQIADDMTLVVEGGVVWVEDADCPDKICQSKRIKKTNDPIYCLPNKICILIVGEYIDDPYGSDI